MDLASKKVTYLSDSVKWNIELFSISPDRKTLAFVSNEDGVSRLHLLDTTTNKERPVTWPRVGVISNVRWHKNSNDRDISCDKTRAVVGRASEKGAREESTSGEVWTVW